MAYARLSSGYGPHLAGSVIVFAISILFEPAPTRAATEPPVQQEAVGVCVAPWESGCDCFHP
eukprot:2494-Eustigmatos_ZCMA.PRE.1